jgi:hypothetical protein
MRIFKWTNTEQFEATSFQAANGQAGEVACAVRIEEDAYLTLRVQGILQTPDA